MNRLKLNENKENKQKRERVKMLLENIKKNDKLYKSIKIYLPIEIIYYIYYGTISEDIYNNYIKNSSDYIRGYRDNDNTISNYLICSTFEYILMGHLYYYNNGLENNQLEKIGEENIDKSRNINKITNEPDIKFFNYYYEVQVNFNNDKCYIKKSKIENIYNKYGNKAELVQFYKSDKGLRFKYIKLKDIIDKGVLFKSPNCDNKESYLYNMDNEKSYSILDTIINYL